MKEMHFINTHYHGENEVKGILKVEPYLIEFLTPYKNNITW